MENKEFVKIVSNKMNRVYYSVYDLLNVYYDADDKKERAEKHIIQFKELVYNNFEQFSILFPVEYVENLFNIFFNLCYKALNDKYLKSPKAVLANLSTLFDIFNSQIKAWRFCVQIAEINATTPVNVSFFDRFKNKLVDYDIFENESIIIPLFEEKTKIIFSLEDNKNGTVFEINKSKYFMYEKFSYHGKELISRDELTADFSSYIVEHRALDCMDFLNKNIDFRKVGYLKTIKISKTQHVNNFLKAEIVLLIIETCDSSNEMRTRIIDLVFENTYARLINCYEQQFLLKINGCFENKQKFKQHYLKQYYTFMYLIDNINEKESLIPFYEFYKNDNNIKSKVSAILADDILIDYYYCDLDFTVNCFKRSKDIFTQEASLAKKDSRKLFEVIYKFLKE